MRAWGTRPTHTGWRAVWSGVVLLLLAACSTPPPVDSALPPPSSGVDPSSAAPVAVEDGDERWVAVDGDDEADGSADDPWATLGHALTQIGPGDSLTVRPGEYRERIRGLDLTAGEEARPITVRAEDGGRVVIRGLMWLSGIDHWSLDGMDVTWDVERNESDEHMVKITDGTGWSITRAEIWGARSFAAVLIASSGGDEPADWRISGSCIHSTAPANSTNQDHLIYVNSGLRSGPGLIEGNVLFDAANGNGVKLGGPSPGSGGAAEITLRHNTIADTAQGVLISWDARDNLVEGNVLAGVGEGYGLVRGFQLDGDRNLLRGNVGWDAERFVLNDGGFTGIVDDGDNRLLTDMAFDSTGSCGAYVPEDDLGPVGAEAYEGPARWRESRTS